MRDIYWEDLKSGDTFISPSFTLTDHEMIAFAEKYDPQPFPASTRRPPQPPIFADLWQALQTAALAGALAIKTGVFKKMAIAGLGVDGLRWLKPVRAGDTLDLPVRGAGNSKVFIKTGPGYCGVTFRSHQ